ncbi:TetR/AcrR family transcriptional regulator [Aquincola sp. MAHUQ-54]|uniref:TetR/AcrR family transcriptional regulator n=1 Tax=Aquincola agrisoli TaxID=3119538 RepID=A0AAW9PZ68_9BURK
MQPKRSRREVTHDRIVETAARAIRRAGYAGVGVADIMREAGLTHGGFYAHFASRNALLAEAIERAGRDSAARLDERTAARLARGASPLRALVELYLADAHLASTEQGCPVAALVSEMPRQAPEVQEASVARVQKLVERVRAALPPGVPEDRAPVIAGTLVGSLQIARALGDNARGRAVLAAARKALIADHDKP